jgi:hypothetical protein
MKLRRKKPVIPKPRENPVEKDWDHIPFGKFSLEKGYYLCDVPTWYLSWFVKDMDDSDSRYPGLYKCVEAELWERSDR